MKRSFAPLEKRAKESVKISCKALAARKHIFLTGFTLAELLVVVCIFFILIAAAFLVLNSGINSWLTGDVEVSLRRELVKAVIPMEKELKFTQAAQTNLASGSTSNTITFAIPADIDSDGTILNSAGRIEWSPDLITYSLNANGEIVRTTPAATSILARNITGLQFTRPVSPVNVIEVNVTATRQNSKGRVFTDAAQFIIKMRN
ncbi:MAG: hypothetical protein PHP17_00300 [Candidatus Omnitrophica bacterium]|nr:hypothetical protein [Candidatus Omnitrophota bacterium]